MKNILTIFKKEFSRVIKDRRLVITIMILPGLMIFLIYTIIGVAMQNITQKEIYSVAIVNPQVEFKEIYENYYDINEYDYDLNVITINIDLIDDYKQKIDDNEWDFLIVFDESINTYDGTGNKPIVDIYSNPNEIASNTIKTDFMYYLQIYEETLSTEAFGDRIYFQVNVEGTTTDENGMVGKIISMMVPMLIIMFLFSGAMAIGPESIAGEKERGTMATLLVTPVKRREIAIGKISALSLLTLISATSSFIGILLSLPRLMQFDENMNTNIYNFLDYMCILIVLFSTVFIIVGLISIISAYAKNLKEASSLITPIYILTILVSITSMFGDGAMQNVFLYMIPIYNSVQTLIAILTFDTMSLTYLLITIISNFMYLVFFIIILNKMFNSEKVMFSK